MSRFLAKKYAHLKPYTPGEQPQEQKFIKLNTNENPFQLPLSVRREIQRNGKLFQLYPDPECKKLRRMLSSLYGIKQDEVVLSNGSDEILNFIFQGFCDNGAVFPDITYGFYPVFASLNMVNYRTIPLKEDFSIDIRDYYNANSTIFIANPNAPTGLTLTVEQIEEILFKNRNNIVVIDEAYVDFGAKSCIPLIKKYDNLIVVQTFSKSRFMAGLRLGMAFANPDIIRDLNAIRYSVNPYNVNRATMAAGCGIIRNEKYRKKCSLEIAKTRAWTIRELKKLGFEVTDSLANFIFTRTPLIDGESLYLKLKDKGVLVRHFSQDRIKDYNRISIGSIGDMKKFIKITCEILNEEKDEKGRN